MAEEIEGLWVSVDRVLYMPLASTPPDRPHQFAYFITIHNDSNLHVTILRRKWVVRYGDGKLLIVEGDGVVGEYPSLKPGEQFHYNSYHLVDRAAVAEGLYFGRDEEGREVVARIPEFELKPGSKTSE